MIRVAQIIGGAAGVVHHLLQVRAERRKVVGRAGLPPHLHAEAGGAAPLRDKLGRQLRRLIEAAPRLAPARRHVRLLVPAEDGGRVAQVDDGREARLESLDGVKEGVGHVRSRASSQGCGTASHQSPCTTSERSNTINPAVSSAAACRAPLPRSRSAAYTCSQMPPTTGVPRVTSRASSAPPVTLRQGGAPCRTASPRETARYYRPTNT